MRGKARHHGDEPAVAIETCDVPLAVGRIRQAMQQHHGADRLAIRLKHKGTIEVLLKAAGIDRAAVEIAIDRNPIVRRQLLGDLAAQFVEDRGFVRDILFPVGGVEFGCAQFFRNESVPGFERQPALGVVDAHPEKCHQDERYGSRNDLGREDELSCHFCSAGFRRWRAP